MVNDGQKMIVKQIKSVSGRTKEVRETLTALGLGKIGKTREHTANTAVLGMLRKVSHLVDIRKA
jgi:large subunit ribosomal protein L30